MAHSNNPILNCDTKCTVQRCILTLTLKHLLLDFTFALHKCTSYCGAGSKNGLVIVRQGVFINCMLDGERENSGTQQHICLHVKTV